MFVHYEKWSEIKMEINDELQHMITPYINLYGMKNENSKPYYMIAEFIDNSLSSWVENKMTSDLKIDVYHNYNNGILRISDNAFGMDKQQLGNSIQLYDEKDRKCLEYVWCRDEKSFVLIWWRFIYFYKTTMAECQDLKLISRFLIKLTLMKWKNK
jgi:hypothetical protein